jgi:hypothetical protein
MHKKLKELLEKLGVKDDTIALFTDETKTEELEALKVTDVVSHVDETYKTRFESDKAFLSPIENKMRGKVLNSKQRHIMKLVPEITKEEMEAIPEDTRFDDMLSLAIEKIAARSGSKVDETEAVKTAKAEALKWQNRAKELEDIEIPKIKGGHQQALEDRDIMDFTKSMLNEKKDGILGNVDFLAKSAFQATKEDYVVKMVEGKPQLFQKPDKDDDDLKPVYNGNAVLEYGANINKFLSDNKFVRESNAIPPTPNGTPPSDGKGSSTVYNLPGLAAAEALEKN